MRAEIAFADVPCYVPHQVARDELAEHHRADVVGDEVGARHAGDELSWCGGGQPDRRKDHRGLGVGEDPEETCGGIREALLEIDREHGAEFAQRGADVESGGGCQ